MKTFICLWLVLLVLSFLDLCLCGGPENVTAEPGQDAILTCGAAGNGKVSVVRLTRDDLKPDCVLLYRNDYIDEDLQNPQYLGRTNLERPTSIDGKVHLTLHNVTDKDSGTYECRVKTETKSNRRRKRDASERTIIHLSVAAAKSDHPGNKDGNSRSHAVSVFAAVPVIVSMVIITVIMRKRNKPPSPPDDADEPHLI